MSDATQAVYSAASELGFKLDSTEGNSSEEVTTENTEVQGEAANEEVEAAPDVEGNENADSVVADEELNKVATEANAEEEPKLTFKQFQELEAKRAEIEAKEKAFMERMQAQEKEFNEKHHEKVKAYDHVDGLLDFISQKDPELFAIFQDMNAEFEKESSDPRFTKLTSEMAELKKELGMFKNNASDEVTLTKLDSEFNEFLGTTGKEAEAAGVKIDRKIIEDMWVKGLTVKEAFHAKYGESYAKALASKQKVATATKKVEARPAVSTAGNLSRSNSPASANVPKNSFDAVRHFASNLTGNSY